MAKDIFYTKQGCLILLFSLLASSLMSAQSDCFALPKALREVSGLAIAAPDSLWWINDGGNAPVLFLTNAQGQLLKEIPIAGTRNRDWEDLAQGPDGQLFIGDFGNNLNNRRDMRIYLYRPQTRELDSLLFDFADQKAFPPQDYRYSDYDVEAFFYAADSLHLFTKSKMKKSRFYTKHYVLPAQPGHYTAAPRDSLVLKNRVITGAAMSPNGTKVALLSYHLRLWAGFVPVSRTSIFWLDNYLPGQWLKGRVRQQKVRTGLAITLYESIDFLNENEVLIASEWMPLYKAKAKKVKSRD